MGAPVHFPRLSSEWLRHVNDPALDYLEVTVPAATGDLSTGTVMGKITASGKWVPHVAGATDGSEDAAGILLDGVDASGAADVKAVVVRSNATIMVGALSWHASVNLQGEKDAALAALAALRIIPVRAF